MNADDHQTITAIAALLVWPIISIFIFAGCKSLSRGLIWSELAALLILPVGATIKFQMVPPLDKTTVANFSALVGCILFAGAHRTEHSRKFGLVELLLILYVVSPAATSMMNKDDIVIGGLTLPGVGLYDAASAAEAALITVIPFLLGRRFLRRGKDCQNILVALVIASLAYSILFLFEMRFSPQLHYWVYGYYPTNFDQTVRDGGYRPMVFMGHGLQAAFFLMTSVLAAFSFLRTHTKVGPISSSVAAGYLGLLLLIFKSKAALLYGFVGGFLILFTKPRIQFRVAVVLAALSLSYPLLRSFDLVPTTTIVNLAESISEDRAGSLKFRFDNEDKLLHRAFERPLLGWGRFGRSRVYDADTGKDMSITDGRWIIDLGQFGLIGFLAEFGLLSLSVFRAAAAFRYAQSLKEQISFATLTLIVSINIFDLLPNSGLIPWTWLLAGALLGRADELVNARSSTRRVPVGSAIPHSRSISASIQRDVARPAKNRLDRLRPRQ